jgi:hypothetical protein
MGRLPGLPDGLSEKNPKNPNFGYILEGLGIVNFGIFYCHLV